MNGRITSFGGKRCINIQQNNKRALECLEKMHAKLFALCCLYILLHVTAQELWKNDNLRCGSGNKCYAKAASNNELVKKRYFPDDVFRAFQSRFEGGCACTGKKHLLDLGNNYVPRYIPDMVCSAGNCGELDCKSHMYKVFVMRKRDEGDLEPGAAPVPIELRENWIGETRHVTVGCICSP